MPNKETERRRNKKEEEEETVGERKGEENDPIIC